MDFIPAANCYKVEARMSVIGNKVENVLWVQNPSGIDAQDSDIIASNLKTAWDTTLKPNLATDVSLDYIVVTDWSQENGNSWIYVTGLPLVGTGAALKTMPGNVTCSVAFKTNKRGRSYMGRNYVIGIPTAQVEGDTMTTGLRDQYLSYYNTWRAAIALNGLNHVICSFFTNGAPRTTAEVTLVTSILMGRTLDSQRRRLTSRGR